VDCWNSAFVIRWLLLMRLASVTLPSLMGTLKSALTTTCEAGLRFFASNDSVAFFISLV
jgi:hypothetical protein